MSYYKVVEGKKLDARLLDIADKVIAGEGDGRISLADAQELLEAVKDGGTYTEVEKETMEHIRKNYNWTDAADDWFRGEIAKWALTK
jgi:hypothetical protein